MAVAASHRTTRVTHPVQRTAQSAAFGPGGTLISVRDLSRTFESPSGAIHALDDVSLDIRTGEFLAIVGPSGCGKTTLLRILAGLEKPTSGGLHAAGQFPSNALIFQGRSVFPWMTVEDNITYGLKLSGVARSERRDRAISLLRLIGIERFRKSYPHQLSEGMRQRVAIARALAVDPDLLLMDEPFSALDEQTKLVLQDEVLDIWERTRKTIVFITHSIDEALVMADRIVVMTAQPGQIKSIIDVEFPRPRDFLTVRSDPHFAERFRCVWELLKDEVKMASRQPLEVPR
ncbi:MAG TPA: ABC transporter ATP-binding protein [Thermomicrobiales bacterium]|jgi:NitT/TauT family transport system ATP-binding protein|nr:ABC transporter ATP-binding protein [Thermomicrobiales bacterium]